MDTTPEAWEIYLDLQRKLTPAQKMQQVFEWSDAIRQCATAGMRARYPDADEREIFLRVTRMYLDDDELFRKVYGNELDNASTGPVG